MRKLFQLPHPDTFASYHPVSLLSWCTGIAQLLRCVQMWERIQLGFLLAFLFIFLKNDDQLCVKRAIIEETHHDFVSEA